MMTARALAADYPVATAPADFVIKPAAEWTRVQCAVFDDKIIVLVAGDGLFDGNGTAKNATFTVVVTPIAPYSLTSPSPPAPLAPGGTGQATVTYEGGGQDSLVDTFEFKKPEGRTLIRLFVVPVKLQSIGFGNTIGDLQRDDGTTYESPQWQDGNHDNVVLPGSADPGEDADRNYPVGFVRNTKPKLTDKTVVKLGGPLPDGITLYLGAESDPNGVEIDAALLQVDGSHLATLVAAPVASTEVLHDSINYYDAGSSAPGRIFKVEWKVRVGGGSFLSVAETRHTLYKTAAMPLLGAFGLRESMVYYACYGARQADPGSPVEIADKIQERVFGTKKMRQVLAARAPASMEDNPGEYLKYQAGAAATGYLPADKSNVCAAWASFMRDTFKIHGLNQACVVDLFRDNSEAAAYNSYKVVLFLTREQEVGAAGQETPPSMANISRGQGDGGYGVNQDGWMGHSITGLSDAGADGRLARLYDPSYGTGPFFGMDGQNGYEAKGAAGFKGFDAPNENYFYWRDRPSVKEIKVIEIKR